MIRKKYNNKDFSLMFLSWLFPALILTQTIPRFQESDGVIIVEVESAVEYSSWELDTNKAGYTGLGYLQYKGSNLFNDPGKSLLPFEIAIEKTGKYRFQWHSLIAVGESNTEHNDSWLRFKDASDFYGQKNDEKVYPKGVGKTPNPEGSSARGWMKIYQNSRDGWTWQTRTSDRDPHDIFVEFDSAGIYMLEISGRSNGHAIDRLALYHSEVSASAALDLARQESAQIQTTSITGLDTPTRLQIRPTLATDFISIQLPDALQPGRHEAAVLNYAGQNMLSFPFHKTENDRSFVVPISQLSSGYYFVHFKTIKHQYHGRFLKQ